MKVTFTPGSSNDADDACTFWFDPVTGRVERVGGVPFSDQENYGVDGDKVPVDTLTPEYIAGSMRLLSTVVINDVTVEPL